MQRIRPVIATVAVSLLIMVSLAPAASKVLYVDSYHAGYAWSDGITAGIKSVLGDKAELKVHRMDTKRNATTEARQQAAAEAKALIESWQPDVVIASDDNASKFLIAPHFKDAELPFVFCGVNWDASVYGFPTDNICGMEEVTLVDALLGQLQKFADGDKIGFLAPDTETGHKEKTNVEKKFELTLDAYFAQDFADWKTGFKQLQDTCDMVIIDSDGGLYADHADEMKAFVKANTTRPTGACYDFMAPYAVISLGKLASEQGEWAAAAALRILDGESPAAIGVTQNKKGKLYVNLPLAKAAGITIPLSTLKNAEVIKE